MKRNFTVYVREVSVHPISIEAADPFDAISLVQEGKGFGHDRHIDGPMDLPSWSVSEENEDGDQIHYWDYKDIPTGN